MRAHRSCLEFFYSRMSPGGIILSHDYMTAPGVKKAFDDFFEDRAEPSAGDGRVAMPCRESVKNCFFCFCGKNRSSLTLQEFASRPPGRPVAIVPYYLFKKMQEIFVRVIPGHHGRSRPPRGKGDDHLYDTGFSGMRFL